MTTTNNMINRRVTVPGTTGTVVEWQPLGPALCDILVREDSGRMCWYASHAVGVADGLGPLPSRRDAQAAADAKALVMLRAIRKQHVAEFHKPWPGAEHGKAIVGRAIDAALAEVSRRRQ